MIPNKYPPFQSIKSMNIATVDLLKITIRKFGGYKSFMALGIDLSVSKDVSDFMDRYERMFPKKRNKT